MNYRHAFHAGNFADVLKHVVLARLLEHMKKKDKPFRVIDAHAGIGLYDLSGIEAGKTGEWEGGIGKLAEPFDAEVEALPDLAAVQAWPMLRILASIAPFTAASRSASSKTRNGALPPSSIEVRRMR